MTEHKKLKRPILLVAGILLIASIFLPLWSLSMTGEITIDDEPLGNAYANVTATNFNVNVSMKFVVGEETASEYTSIQYTDLNYSTDVEEWIFASPNTTIPADAVTRYIYPIVPVISIIGGIGIIMLAFVDIKKSNRWIAILLIILAILPALYFWYSWNTYLGHANLTFFQESGSLLDLPTGIVVSGNPGLGWWLLLIGAIMSVIFIAIPYAKKTMYKS